MKLELMIIGSLLFGLVFYLSAALVADVASQYDLSIDTSTTFGQITYGAQQVYGNTDDMREDLSSYGVTEGSAEDDMYSAGYTTIKSRVPSSVAFLGNTTSILLSSPGFNEYIDPAIITFLKICLVILVVFAILAIIFRFRQGA